MIKQTESVSRRELLVGIGACLGSSGLLGHATAAVAKADQQSAAGPPVVVSTEQEQLRAVKRILDAFVAESLPEGGIDAKKSLWQKPGKGSASGSSMFPGGIDVRYLRFLVEGLYRVAALTGDKQYHTVADNHVRFMARSSGESRSPRSGGPHFAIFLVDTESSAPKTPVGPTT
jgi:hypothetical protein